MTVIETDDFRPESDGEDENAHAAPARDEEMPQLVEKNDDAEDEQKGNDISRNATAKRVQMRHKLDPMMLALTP